MVSEVGLKKALRSPNFPAIIDNWLQLSFWLKGHAFLVLLTKKSQAIKENISFVRNCRERS